MPLPCSWQGQVNPVLANSASLLQHIHPVSLVIASPSLAKMIRGSSEEKEVVGASIISSH